MSFDVCVIGCGSMSTSGHGPSFRLYAEQHPDVRLAACCDLDAEKAERYRASFGFEACYTDLRTMLAKEKPDAVCLIAPVDLTASLSIEVMELGFPLLMEKPPGLGRDECRAMIAAAERSGVPNQVSFNRRYTPVLVRLKHILSQQLASSDIQNVRYEVFRHRRNDPDFSTTAIHGIDATRFLAGADYANVRFRYQEFPDLGPGVANIYMDCTFSSGATGQLSFCPVAGVLIERATVNTSDHTFFLDLPVQGAYDFPGRLVHVHNKETVLDVPADELSGGVDPFVLFGFFGENASFLDDLRAGRRPEGDIRSGLQSVEVAECIRHRKPVFEAD